MKPTILSRKRRVWDTASLLWCDPFFLLRRGNNLLNRASHVADRPGQTGDAEGHAGPADCPGAGGADADMLPHIFELFTQVDVSAERPQRGWGSNPQSPGFEPGRFAGLHTAPLLACSAVKVGRLRDVRSLAAVSLADVEQHCASSEEVRRPVTFSTVFAAASSFAADWPGVSGVEVRSRCHRHQPSQVVGP
jgi:hypothetical protein